MSKATITIEVDEDTRTVKVERSHEPEIPEVSTTDQWHAAGIIAAVGFEALNQATDARCTSCAYLAVQNLRHMADAIHAGKETINSMAPDNEQTKH